MQYAILNRSADSDANNFFFFKFSLNKLSDHKQVI